MKELTWVTHANAALVSITAAMMTPPEKTGDVYAHLSAAKAQLLSALAEVELSAMRAASKAFLESQATEGKAGE